LAGKAALKKNLSALKRARQAEKRRLRNQAGETEIKTCIKKLEAVLSTKNKEDIAKTLKESIKLIDSAASKGIIHRNTASRKISNLTKKVNAALAQST
jgi:small subunit ribosomal protein S20